MAPLFPIAGWLGATVTMQENDPSIVISKGSTTLQLSLNSTKAVLNGKTLTLYDAPTYIGGTEKVLVPVDVIHKAFKVKVVWKNANTKITLTRRGIKAPLDLFTWPTFVHVQDPSDPPEDPFTVAIDTGDLEQVKSLLIQHPKWLNKRYPKWLNERFCEKLTPVILAAGDGNTAAVKLLIDKGANVKAAGSRTRINALHCAASDGNQELVELLVSKGVNINIAMQGGLTPLHLACYIPSSSDKDEINKQVTLVTWLLDHGAKSDAIGIFPNRIPDIDLKAMKHLPGFGTPLMYAVMKDNSDITQVLIKHGATPLTRELQEAVVAVIKKGAGGSL